MAETTTIVIPFRKSIRSGGGNCVEAALAAVTTREESRG